MNMDVFKKLSYVRLIHKALWAIFMESWCFRDVEHFNVSTLSALRLVTAHKILANMNYEYCRRES